MEQTKRNLSTPSGVPRSGHVKDRISPHKSALNLVPRGLALETGILPIKIEGEKLIVLADEQVDPVRLQKFQLALKREVVVWPVPTDVLRGAMRETYGDAAIPELDGLVDAVTQRARKQIFTGSAKPLEFAKRPTNVVAITSGKGGVGKTTLSVNLGMSLARLGFQVAIIDADYGLANVHVMLGMKPDRTLEHVLLGSVGALDALTVGPHGLRVLAGSAGLSLMDYDRLVAGGAGFDVFRGLFDFVLVDTSAGAHPAVTSLLTAADESIFVMTEDPASIHDAYVTAKTLFGLKPDCKISCVVNQVRSESDAKIIFAKFQAVFTTATNRRSQYLGFIREDQAVVQSVRSRQPYVLAAPKSRAAADLEEIAHSVASLAPAASRGFLGKLFNKSSQKVAISADPESLIFGTPTR